ncbi:MAG: imidazole glycerol phosphate synthase subunit HisH [Hyphococcus sp.]
MAQRLAIIDYGSGNLRSVEKALARAAREHGLALHIDLTDDPETIASADRLLLPGVGAFGACMDGLAARGGVLEAMQHAALVEERPFLGICVGMQLLAETGEEYGEHRGLGWIPGRVGALGRDDPAIRRPHMGWSEITLSAPHHLLDDLDEAHFYFAHSYHFEAGNRSHALAYAVHGAPFVAAVGRDNIAGVQFHPEKSQAAGMTLLKNFLTWDPS